MSEGSEDSEKMGEFGRPRHVKGNRTWHPKKESRGKEMPAPSEDVPPSEEWTDARKLPETESPIQVSETEGIVTDPTKMERDVLYGPIVYKGDTYLMRMTSDGQLQTWVKTD